MRDLPSVVSVAVFAKHLRCSVDSAKRWLGTWPASTSVGVAKSPGGTWSVTLPNGEYSLLRCRLQRMLEKLFQRKQTASKAMPFAIGRAGIHAGLGEEAGVDAPWMWRDVDALFKQVSEELEPPRDAASADTERDPETEAVIASRLLAVDDATLMALIVPYVLAQAAFRLQKTDKRLTVPALAEVLGISHASLYRNPFGKGAVQAALRQAAGQNQAPKEAVTKAKAEALAGEEVKMTIATKTARVAAVREGTAVPRRQEQRKYKERKRHRDQKQEIKARHFLCWQGIDWPTGRQATLSLIPEAEVDRSVRPSYPSNPLKHPLPTYSDQEMDGILCWLGQNAVMERDPVAAISAKEDQSGYQWYFDGGQYRGEAPSWDEAAAKILKLLQPDKLRPKRVVLNPMQDGLYRVPLFLGR